MKKYTEMSPFPMALVRIEKFDNTRCWWGSEGNHSLLVGMQINATPVEANLAAYIKLTQILMANKHENVLMLTSSE